MKRALFLLLAGLVLAAAAPIDRKALVTRHNITLTKVDPHAPLMLGNGDLGFTADITGLQTFPEQYSNLAPLLTMAQWAWHSAPNRQGFAETDGLVKVPVEGRGEKLFPYFADFKELDSKPALNWLRENPHRFSLGRIGLALTGRDGKPAAFASLMATRQRLDLWTGALFSSFTFEGQPVLVETRVCADRDVVMVAITSPLVAAGRLGVDVRYPGVGTKLNPDPSDFSDAAQHKTERVSSAPGRLTLRRTIDDTVYYSSIVAPGATVATTGPHAFLVQSRSGNRLVVQVSFDRTQIATVPDYAQGVAGVTQRWRDYWTKGGVVDFSGSSNPRASELERRVVLSQYLAAINEAGTIPPQEEGLFSNSWNGKFHLEMHAWHSAHFAPWGRPALIERSLDWYLTDLPVAKAEAKRHGVEGAWWAKMAGPEGRNSPSPISPFLMWQQPHPIYLAELVYRAKPDAAVLARYGEIVEQSARLLASWPRWDGTRFVLGPPMIPVQENYPPLKTMNPAFELEYFRWGLQVAQAWRERRGLSREAEWDRVIAKMAPLARRDGLYLPAETAPDFWRTAATAACKRHASQPQCQNRDHPSFLMTYGFIGGDRVDPETMRRTLRATETDWDIRQTWGWDFPMVAMTAARLGEPEKAVDWLFMDLKNNQWGVSGMTPRVHLDEHAADLFRAEAAAVGPDGAGYRRAAETYFPSNGSLLLAVGMMAAGWDGSSGAAPGFPKTGWTVRSEGIKPLP